MKILSVGECMVEFFCEDSGLWRRGFAGDTLNTAWVIRAIVPAGFTVGFASQIGSDQISDDLVDFIRRAGISTDALVRSTDRTLGLYTISTDSEGERTFSYWRSNSAARCLADDPNSLARSFEGADIIYLSGITAAILDGSGRQNLLATLAEAKAKGARVIYDSNHRPALWGTVAATREFSDAIGQIADVLLPTYDDEVQIFGNATPRETLERLAAGGCPEIVLTNGADPIHVWHDGMIDTVPVENPVTPVDTTGAGDSFSGSYIAARTLGNSPLDAVRLAQKVSRTVVQHRGALVAMDTLRDAFNAS